MSSWCENLLLSKVILLKSVGIDVCLTKLKCACKAVECVKDKEITEGAKISQFLHFSKDKNNK